MWKILFPAKSHHKRGGGQLKFRDYFLHCLAHPDLDPYLSFTDAGRYAQEGIWSEVPQDRVVGDIDPSAYDLFFVSGRNWKYLPDDLGGRPVLNLLQSLAECAPGSREFRHFARPALRICVSQAVQRASAPYRTGDALVIEPGIPLDLFTPAGVHDEQSVVIWGRKHRGLGGRLCSELSARSASAELLTDYLPREEWARRLAASAVFVGLPREQEGFYLPALEAMASGAAVVCARVGGNEGFCEDGETCIAPSYGDCTGHLAAVQRLLADETLRSGFRERGIATARRYGIGAERAAFHRLLEERVLPGLR